MTSMSLPSIHEMFPDHLLKSDFRPPRPTSGSPAYRTPARSPIPSVCERLTRFHIKPPFGVDGSRNHGHSPHPQDPAYRTRRLSSPDSSLPHLSNRSYPCNTNGGNSLEPDFEDDDCPVGRSMPSIDGALLGNNMDALGRKHVCPTCFKRFNRPSSLRIHLNTHTGATPFKCPFPSCGREFNVNSNMRRHYRNHYGTLRGQGNFPPTHGANELRPLAPATTRSIPAHHSYSEGSHSAKTDHPQSRIRQRRPEEDREIPVPIAVRDVNTPRTHQGQHYGLNYLESSYGKYAPMPSPPTSHSSSSDEALDMEMDEENARTSSSRFRNRRPVIQDKIDKRPIGGLEGQYARLHTASSRGSVSPSSQASSIASRTSSPTGTERHFSEHSQKPKYSASKPYSASFGDARVRTTLRPVFM